MGVFGGAGAFVACSRIPIYSSDSYILRLERTRRCAKQSPQRWIPHPDLLTGLIDDTHLRRHAPHGNLPTANVMYLEAFTPSHPKCTTHMQARSRQPPALTSFGAACWSLGVFSHKVCPAPLLERRHTIPSPTEARSTSLAVEAASRRGAASFHGGAAPG